MELAELTGLSAPAISQYESGKRVPSSKAFLLLSNALQVTPLYLMHGVEYPDITEVEQEALQLVRTLSPSDFELLDLFKKLSPKQKEASLEYFEYLVSNQKTNGR